MSACQSDFEALSAFVDGELDAAEELGVRRHLDVCARCSQQVAVFQRLKTAVGRSAVDEPLPLAMSRALRAEGATPRRHRLGRWAARGFAAAAVAAALMLWLTRSDTPDPFTTALIADHIHYAHHPERLQVAESDPQALRRWFASRLPFEPELPEIRGAQVVGGRLCTLRGNHLALAFADRGGEPLSIFVGDAQVLTLDARRAWASAAGGERCSDALDGYRVCFGRNGRLVTAIVGPAHLPPPA